MTNGAQSAAGITTYRTVRELGSRSPRSYAAIREPNELVVTYRYARAADAKVSNNVATYVGNDGAIALGSEAMANLTRDAKCLEKNWHPNIARVRHVDLAADELIVATELVDGATLEDLFSFAAAKRAAGSTSAVAEPFLPLPVVVRILVDVLAGLHGLHGLRDAPSGTLGVIHGALCPANIVVGKDGVARIINALRARPVQVGASSEAVGYGAPEALDVGGTSDLRSDVHAVGVILWEALTGRRLYKEKDPVRVLARQREEEIEPPAFPPGSPFAGLTEVVLHALAFDPALRFKTAAEMGAALRAAAGARIATGSVVAAQVAELAGERIRARRIELDPSSSGTRRRASLAPMKAAPPASTMSSATPAASNVASPDAPAPLSTRATVPPAALGALDSLNSRGARNGPDARDAEEEAPPASVREELSLRDLMSAAPPLHESAMVEHVPMARVPDLPPAPEVAPVQAAAPAPRAAPAPAPATKPRAAPAPAARAATAAPATAPRAAPAPAARAAAAPVPRAAAAAIPRAATASLQRPATAPIAGAPAVPRNMPAKAPPPMSKRPPPPTPAAVVAPKHPEDDNAPTAVVAPKHPEDDDAPTSVVAPKHPEDDDAPTGVVAPRHPEDDDAPTGVVAPKHPEDTARLLVTAAMPAITAPLDAEHPIENTAKLLAPAQADERTSTPDKTFAPVTDESLAAEPTDSSPMQMFSAPPPPPLRKMPPAVLAGALVLALIGAGLALRAIFSDAPAPPTTTAGAVRPSAELPSTTVTAPAATTSEPASADPKANAEAEAKASADAKAKAEADAKTEAEAKARDEAAAKTTESTPTTEPPSTTPHGATAPAAPRVVNPNPNPRPATPAGRPKKPYEPSGI